MKNIEQIILGEEQADHLGSGGLAFQPSAFLGLGVSLLHGHQPPSASPSLSVGRVTDTGTVYWGAALLTPVSLGLTQTCPLWAEVVLVPSVLWNSIASPFFPNHYHCHCFQVFTAWHVLCIYPAIYIHNLISVSWRYKSMCVYICVCMCMYMYVGVCIYICVCIICVYIYIFLST